ncbi:hypothetical protein [Roseateles sp. P5_E7]
MLALNARHRPHHVQPAAAAQFLQRAVLRDQLGRGLQRDRHAGRFQRLAQQHGGVAALQLGLGRHMRDAQQAQRGVGHERRGGGGQQQFATTQGHRASVAQASAAFQSPHRLR